MIRCPKVPRELPERCEKGKIGKGAACDDDADCGEGKHCCPDVCKNGNKCVKVKRKATKKGRKNKKGKGKKKND